MPDNIIISPEYEGLCREIEQLKTELSMLVAEKDELRYVICKNIKTAYLLKFGAAEYKLYEIECNYFLLKRKLTLIQTKINRQEPVELDSIQRILDSEFEEYKQKLDKKIDSINKALEHSQCSVLSAENEKELKKIYRKIVKALHPDFISNPSEQQKQLFNNAVEAYKNGNLEAIKIIDTIIGENQPTDKRESSLSILEKEKNRILELLERVKRDIQTIKSEYPYIVKDMIEKEKAENYLIDLDEAMKSYQEACSLLEQKINELLR